MKKYVRPVIVANTELAEGVYAGSGDCYTFSARITQVPEGIRDYYVVQMDGVHHATDGHHSTLRNVVVCFNQPVVYLDSMAESCEGSGTNQLVLAYRRTNGSYHNNASENIGLGDLKVQAGENLAVTGIYSNYCNQVCDQH